MLGLKQHLRRAPAAQVRLPLLLVAKAGATSTAVTEIGASRYLAVPSYQIDRGIFENFLGEEARARGVALRRRRDRAPDIALTRGRRGRTASPGASASAARSSRSRWLVDACGRAGLLKRKLGLARDERARRQRGLVPHRGPDRDRRLVRRRRPGAARCEPPARWLSTNHLVGAGYWVWLIPLASGSHSVGIVADAKLHPLDTMNSFEKAMAWLERYQPQPCSTRSSGKRDRLQDFAFLRNFSYGCKQVFSGRRWALTGEAGLFLDPFYSPGSDFIADRQHLHLRADRDATAPAGRSRRTRSSTTRSSTRSTRARSRSTPTSTRCSATRRCCRSR